MKRPRRTTKRALSALVFLWIAAFTIATALAAGTINFRKKEITESNGGWHLAMTILYGGTPPMQHIPMKFSFTPTAIYERYLDDAHGDKPQMRKIPLIGQVPIVESVDVDFGDVRGKVYNKTLFDFTITRSHNFSAGEYSVTVRRADGGQVGSSQTIVLQGENPIIDRRAISFVDTKKKKVDAPQAAASNSAPESKPAASEQETAESEPSPAPAGSSQASEEGAAPDSANAEKVQPTGHGCGCRVGTSSGAGVGASALGIALGVLALRRRRARCMNETR